MTQPPPAPRATLMDVAQLAGVSRTTASFVMTGRRDMRISTDAEQRVLRAARELNYRPSLLARSLRTNQSQTLGLISDVVATEIFAGELVRGSLATALLRSHLLFIGETQGDPKVEKQVIDGLRVSRTPFREAIGILAKGGLIEIKPYRGFYVRSFSRSETADLYELYKRLECFATELAVPANERLRHPTVRKYTS